MSSTNTEILFILHLPPPVHGAAMVGQYINESHIINSTFQCRYINLAMAGNMEDIGKVSLAKVGALFRILVSIRREMKRKPNLVYVTPNACGSAFYKDFIVVQAIKFFGGKVVMHFHNKGVAKGGKKFLNSYLYKCFFKKAKIILLSESLYPDFSKYVSKEDVFFCPNGIPDVEKQMISEHQPFRILYLSNLIVSKGVLDLLDACVILKDKKIEYECLYVSSETNELTCVDFEIEIKKRGLENNVKYLGKKYGKEKNNVYENSDVFVFPTYYPNECFPLVLLEAMQHSLPCISTREGAIPDIIDEGKTGVIVNRRKPYELADALIYLFESNDLRKSMGIAARKKYERLYTLELFEKQMISILKQLS